MSYKFKIRTIVLLLIIGCAYSQSSNHIKPQNGLLWKISGNGLKESSYIIGTSHKVSSLFLDSICGFRIAFNSVTRVVGELSETDLGSTGPEFLEYLKSPAAMMPIDTSYNNIFTELDLERIDSVLFMYSKVKLDKAKFLRPNVVKMIILQMVLSSIYTQQPYKESIDSYIINKAKENGKETIGIETVKEQTNIIYIKDSTLNIEAKQLVYFVNHLPDFIQSRKLSRDAFRKQDLNLLEDIFNGNSNKESQTEDDRILKNRNISWMKKLSTLITEKPTLITVGALHLVGEFGLINQFRKLGYVVNPINE